MSSLICKRRSEYDSDVTMEYQHGPSSPYQHNNNSSYNNNNNNNNINSNQQNQSAILLHSNDTYSSSSSAPYFSPKRIRDVATHSPSSSVVSTGSSPHLLHHQQHHHHYHHNHHHQNGESQISPFYSAEAAAQHRLNRESPFASSTSPISSNDIDKYLPSRRRKARIATSMEALGSQSSNGGSAGHNICNPPSPLASPLQESSGSSSQPRSYVALDSQGEDATGYRASSGEDDSEERIPMRVVREIVARAVCDAETALRAEFTIILQQKLSEQFNSFSKFNEDHVHRLLKESQWSYMS